MQHVNASDYMTGNAKAAVDTALADAKGQRVGGATPSTPAAPSTTTATPPARPAASA